MGTPSQSGAGQDKQSQKVHPFWGIMVIVAALALTFVMVYPFIASRQRELPLPTTEETTVKVADRMAGLSPEARAELAQELLNNRNPMLRLATVEAVEDWKIRQAYPLLQNALEDNSSAVRRRAIEAMWRLDRERGMKLLLAGIVDPDVDIRRGAISQMRFANDKRVVPAVIPLLDDQDTTVRFFAMGVLRKLTEQPYFTRTSDPPEKQKAVIEQWKRWWEREKTRWKHEQKWATAQPIYPRRADPASPFALRALDGSRWRLQDLRGKMVVLHFFGTWCAPCEVEMPVLVRLRETYSPDEVVIIGVAVNETEGERAVRQWIERFKINFPMALATADLVSGYWIQGVPITYIIDGEGRIRYRFEGDRDFESFQRMIEHVRTAR